ncbi:MAG: cation:proton antiporter [Bacilli bacterium]
MLYVIELLKVFAIFATALLLGKLVSKLRLPAILGWLIVGVVFGPYLVSLITFDIINETWYQIFSKILECLAGVMIGREIRFRTIKTYGKQVVGITIVQSLGTFIFVSLVFGLILHFSNLPFYLGFIFGGIALATAPAPALSIVNEYKTKGPITNTLIPLAAIDDIIGVIVFFTVISIVNATSGSASISIWSVLGMVLLPFVFGILFGFIYSIIFKKVQSEKLLFIFYVVFIILTGASALVFDLLVFKTITMNYLLLGMAFSGTVTNLLDEQKHEKIMIPYNKILNVALVIVIINLGMPLDYHLIAGAGLFTLIYIVSRAIGKIGGSFLGGKITKAPDTVTKYLGLTLLPHSGVSLVFTGIAVTTLNSINSSYAEVISGTIVAAAIINEIIAVILARVAFKKAGEIDSN